MNVRSIVASGETYASKRQYNYEHRFALIFKNGMSVDEFVLEALQLVLDGYDSSNPPTLSILSSPIQAMSKVCGCNVRELSVFKNFIRGYKKKLLEVGKSKNLTCPVFLDHAVDIFRKMTSNCSKSDLLVYKFTMLMKIYYGIRTGDILKIKYGHLRLLKPGVFSVGSDGRKGCSSVDSPTVYYVYESRLPEFCLFTVIQNLKKSGLSEDEYILSSRDRRK